MTARDEILAVLREVRYPGLDRSIVDLEYVRTIEAGERGWRIELAPRTSDPQAIQAIEADARARLERAGIRCELVVAPPEAPPQGAAPPPPLIQDLAPGIPLKIAVASGKGGVGKSTVAVNLALALSGLGQRIGLLDADVYGPSIPTMLGVAGQRPEASDGKLLPVEACGIRAMSLGFLVEGLDPIIWRGPLASRALEQLLRDVAWGELDALVLDLPPGTGDIQISIAQKANPSGAVIVSTPQDIALIDAIRGVRMFRKVEIPVLGWVENMSHFECPHCHRPSEIFAPGALRHELERLGVPLLGRVPIDPAVAAGGDDGHPIVLAAPQSAAAAAYRALAEQVLATLAAAPRPS